MRITNPRPRTSDIARCHVLSNSEQIKVPGHCECTQQCDRTPTKFQQRHIFVCHNDNHSAPNRSVSQHGSKGLHQSMTQKWAYIGFCLQLLPVGSMKSMSKSQTHSWAVLSSALARQFEGLVGTYCGLLCLRDMESRPSLSFFACLASAITGFFCSSVDTCSKKHPYFL